MPVAVSDHALLRWLERIGGLNVEGLRRAMEDSLTTAGDAASKMGGGDYLVVIDKAVIVVRDGTATTVMNFRNKAHLARVLTRGDG